MTPDTPRYRCALEKGFLKPAREIYSVKLNAYIEQERVEFGDEFDHDGVPGEWMEPVNEAALAIVQDLVAQKRRQSVAAPQAVSYKPIQPPKNTGLRAILDEDGMSPVQRARPADPRPAERPAPKRRAPARAN